MEVKIIFISLTETKPGDHLVLDIAAFAGFHCFVGPPDCSDGDCPEFRCSALLEKASEICIVLRNLEGGLGGFSGSTARISSNDIFHPVRLYEDN